MTIEVNYAIVFHFEGTTLTSVYDSSDVCEEAFIDLTKMLSHGDKYCLTVEGVIVNLANVLYITKGEVEQWKSAKKH